MKKKDKTCNLCNSYTPSYQIPRKEQKINSFVQVLGKCKITKKDKHPDASCKRWSSYQMRDKIKKG